MPGAFSHPRGRPVPVPATPEELERYESNALGAAASFADPLGLVTLLGPDSIANPMKEAQEGGEALPNILGSMASPVGLMGMYPKAAGALTGLGAYFGGSDDAEAARKSKLAAKPLEAEAQADDEIKTLVDKWKEKDPSLGAIYSSYLDAKKASRANVQGVDKASADEVRRRAGADEQARLSELMARIEKLDPPKQTFAQKYGSIAENWPKVQAGVGVTVGALMGAKGGLTDDLLKYRPWQRAINKYDEAMEPSAIQSFMGKQPDPVKAREAAEKIKGYSDKWGQTGKEHGSLAIPGGSAALAATEVGMFPDAFNLRYAPEDSSDFKLAQERLGSPWGFVSGYGPMSVISGLGGATGAKIFGMPDRGPAMAARGSHATSRLGPGATRDERSAHFQKSIEQDAALRSAANPPPAPAPIVRKRTPAGPRAPVNPANKPATQGQVSQLEQMLQQLAAGQKAAAVQAPQAPVKVSRAKPKGKQAPQAPLTGINSAPTGYSEVLRQRLEKLRNP